MNRLFNIQNQFQVPDGTLVSPFLNSKDSMSGLPFDLLDGFSIAAGEIKPGVESKIHVMPLVTQVTFVRRGELNVKMFELGGREPYEICLVKDEAVLTKNGTFFQLINKTENSCHVLYIVSPAYLFELDNQGSVLYDDSIVLEEDWGEILDENWKSLKSKYHYPTVESRTNAFERLKKR